MLVQLSRAPRCGRCTAYIAARLAAKSPAPSGIKFVFRAASGSPKVSLAHPQAPAASTSKEHVQQEKNIDVGKKADGSKQGAKEYEQIILYEAGSKRLMRISSAAAVMNGIFWSFYVGVLEAQLPSTTWEPWGYVGLGCTALMFAVSHTFAKHWVSKVSYFPDWKLLSVGTYTFFGSERIPRLIKLGGIVVPSTRTNAVYMPFKVKGDTFFSLLDSDDGIFHNRDMLMKLLTTEPGTNAGDTSISSDGDSSKKLQKPWKRRKRNR